MKHLALVILTFPSTILALPRFDPTATMQNVLVPADAAINSVIYRLRATDTTFDFPLDFVLEGNDNSVVSLQTLNCSRFNSVCQANVILEKKLTPGRFYDFIVAVRNPHGTTVRLGCSFRATNSTTPYADIFPGAPSLLKISESAKRNSELGTLIARGNKNRERAVLVELWGSPLFGLRQRLITEKDAEATVVLLGSLDYEAQSSYHLTVLANDPWTEPGNDSRNIASWPLLIAILDEQDTPPVFTLAPPVTTIDPKTRPGDVVLELKAEDGDRGNPRDIRYGLVSEGNPFTPFFNLSEDKGELRLVRPLKDIQAISHAGSPVLLTVAAEEIRTATDEPPPLSTSVQIALILPSPTWTSPHFNIPLYNASIKENSPPGTPLDLPDAEIFGDPGEVITVELVGNNGTFDIFPTVVEGSGKFSVTVRDSQLLDYEARSEVHCEIVAKQLGSEINSVSARLIVNIEDINDNPPVFAQTAWHASILENSETGTSILKVEAYDPDTKSIDSVRYTRLIGEGSEIFHLDPTSGLVVVKNSDGLDAEVTTKFDFVVEAADENGKGLKSNASVIIELIDVNDETPRFEKDVYEMILSSNRKGFTAPAFVKAIDADISPPNNVVHYEIVTQVQNLTIDKNTGELLIRPIWKGTETTILKARAFDDGIPRLWSECEIRIYPPESRTRTITFIVPGHNPDRRAIEDELKALTGAQVTVMEVHPYVDKNDKIFSERSEVIATVTYGPNTVVDVERIQQIYDHKTETSNERIQEAGVTWPWWLLIVFLILLLIVLIILIICCICAPCPLYMPPRKRKVGSADETRLVVEGQGHGMNSKSVQVAEWFGRREAWTPEGPIAETEVESLRRHEYERGSERGTRVRAKDVASKTEDLREQLYIREGNADILRLITRGGETGHHQRPITLVEHGGVEVGKDIIMQRYIDQQSNSRVAAVSLPNEVNRVPTEHEQLEATLREQNNLLRQILMERERELRLETQSLPAGTQTDRDAFTQTDPDYLRPPQRLTRSDNDASDPSDEETVEPRKTKDHRRSRKKNRSIPLRRRIKTPILEESESNLDISDTQTSEKSVLRARILRELFGEKQVVKPRITRSALRKEVLREIAESLIQSDDSLTDMEAFEDKSRTRKKKQLDHFSDDSLEANEDRFDVRRLTKTANPIQKYRSETDLRSARLYHPETELLAKSSSQVDLTKSFRRRGKKGSSRYMEWYSKAQNGGGSRKDLIDKPPGTSGVTARQVAAEAKARKRASAGRQSQSTSDERSMPVKGPKHHLIQHSEHRFEPALDAAATRRIEDDADSGIALTRPAIAEKKSVFSIAYEDIQRQTRQLRPESGTPL